MARARHKVSVWSEAGLVQDRRRGHHACRVALTRRMGSSPTARVRQTVSTSPTKGSETDAFQRRSFLFKGGAQTDRISSSSISCCATPRSAATATTSASARFRHRRLHRFDEPDGHLQQFFHELLAGRRRRHAGHLRRRAHHKVEGELHLGGTRGPSSFRWTLIIRWGSRNDNDRDTTVTRRPMRFGTPALAGPARALPHRPRRARGPSDSRP